MMWNHTHHIAYYLLAISKNQQHHKQLKLQLAITDQPEGENLLTMPLMSI